MADYSLGFLKFGSKEAKTRQTSYNFGMKSSKSVTKDYATGVNGIAVDSDTVTLKSYVTTDPELAANIRRFIDNAVKEAPKIVAMSGKTVTKEMLMDYNTQLADVRFYKLIRGVVFHLIWNGNAFLEIKFKGKKLKEMYLLDPEYMKIITDEEGNLVRYEQQVNGSPVIKFSPDEIIHISIDNLDSGLRGVAFIKSLQDTMLRKQIAESYLQWILQNNKLAPIVNVKADLNDDVWGHILSQLSIVKINPDMLQVVNTFKEDEIELVRLFSTADFEVIMKYIDVQNQKIIAALQVPPIISGNVDNSNRSNSEVQARLVFYNTIVAFQNVLSEEFNFEMLRKLKWEDVVLKFPSIDQRTDVETLKLAKVMRDELHFTEEAVVEFLKESGFKIPNVEKLFDEVPLMDTTAKIGGEFPSRQPRDKAGLVQNEAQKQEDNKMGVK